MGSASRQTDMLYKGNPLFAAQNGINDNGVFSSGIFTGTRIGVSSTVYQTIWGGPTDDPVMLTQDQSFALSSTSSDDAAAGDGARAVLVDGVNSTYTRVSEIVILNGTASVGLVNKYMRINQLAVCSAGSIGTNVGQIEAIEGGGSTIQCVIQEGHGIDHDAVYTVPKNYHGTLTSFTYAADTNKAVLYRNKANPVSNDAWILGPARLLSGGQISHLAPAYLSLRPTMTFMAQAKAAGSGTDATVNCELVLRRLF